jgi:CRISPR-associated protein Cas2
VIIVRIVVTYDITKNKVRRKVFRILESYGAWKQYSVFELEISDVQHIQMREKIRSVIEEQDRVRFYELCERCVKKVAEIGEPSPEFASNVV